MKNIIKTLSLILVLVIAFGVVGCKKKSSSSTGAVDKPVATTVNPNHYANNTQRDDYIVSNGQCHYTLVIPANAEDYEEKASQIITEYFSKALSVEIKTVKDSELTSTNGKYISLGDTTIMRSSGLSVSFNKYGNAGFRIKTIGDTVFISGARSQLRAGTYYGAQEFLYHVIGWKAYSDTEIFYNQRSNIKMMNFDVTEIPDFDSRTIGYDTVYFNGSYRDLLRLNQNGTSDTTKLPYYAHSHFEVLPPEIYYEKNPDWYWYTGDRGQKASQIPFSADIKSHYYRFGQLCLSNPEVIEESINVLTSQFMKYPNATMVHLGTMDNKYCCNCESCTKWMADNNTNYAGVNVYYTNLVARKVTENISKLDPSRTLWFRMFAYYGTIEPPVNEVNGEFVPDSPLVIPDENVIIQFTPLDADGLETLDHEKNIKHYKYFMGWCSLTDNLAVWKYNTNFYTYFISNKNWDITAEDFRLYYENGVTTMYDQGPLTDSILQMKEMRLYVESKLMWDTSLSWQTLAEEFINVYYGEAAEGVLESYNLMTTHNEKLRTIDNMTGILVLPNPKADDVKYWPYQYVEGQRQVFVKTFDALKVQLDNGEITEEQYQKIYWRVAAVYFENMFMQMQYHMERYSKEHIAETIDLFEEVANRNNVTCFTESIKNSEIYANFIDKWRGQNV